MAEPGGSRDHEHLDDNLREAWEFWSDDHSRASVSENGRMTVAPQKVLTNIEQALERIDLDITVPFALEDVASAEELWVIVDQLSLGSMLLTHAANTAFGILLARYPEDLVRAPIPPELDVRTMTPFRGTDREHELARQVFNRRAGSRTDLDEVEELLPELDSHTSSEVITALLLLIVMYGLKVNALQRRAGKQ
ncbi:hypothetical protein [Pseudonocardia sp. HH130630-07]|uniref:hypothetical protein n=1 Tax=Pseudonocardia sp. HH130630-07 TaxID=1690815 RepID=UPI000814BF7E|nr:hypothetical protein [Pseudonocardia sp. HH130630-07]ANY10639.1 hypothetical protein AFB00_29985 [Pseudonocardia sp. HH130630-07]